MTAKMWGSQIIDGIGQRVNVRDTRGDTRQVLGGMDNNVRYTGDRGQNTFYLGGMHNDSEVFNLGRNDRVIVDGDPGDWEFTSDSDRGDGVVSGYNRRTGNHVRVATDDGRNDNFVQDRVIFAGTGRTINQEIDRQHYQNPGWSMAGHGGWDDLGCMGHNPGIFDYPYFSGRDQAMFEAGRVFGHYEAGMYGGGYGDHHCDCHYPMWGDPWGGGDPWFLLGGAFGSILLG